MSDDRDRQKEAAQKIYLRTRDDATRAHSAANTARLRAATERDPQGPLHQAAQAATDRASGFDTALAMQADRLEYWSAPETAIAPVSDQAEKKSTRSWWSGRPWWQYALGGVGVLGAGYIGVRVLRRGGKK